MRIIGYEIDWQWFLLLHSLSHTDSIFCNATGNWACVCVYVCIVYRVCMWRRQNHVSAGEWWRDASNSRRTLVCLCFRVVKAVDLEFKLLNNNNTCSHLAFIVLLFPLRFIVVGSSSCAVPHQQITAVCEFMCHRFISVFSSCDYKYVRFSLSIRS